jgi:hypothetical protein
MILIKATILPHAPPHPFPSMKFPGVPLLIVWPGSDGCPPPGLARGHNFARMAGRKMLRVQLLLRHRQETDCFFLSGCTFLASDDFRVFMCFGALRQVGSALAGSAGAHRFHELERPWRERHSR